MKGFRQVIVVFFVAVLSLVITGCGQRMQCPSPNVMIGDTCCLDSDGDGVCDTWEDDDDEELEVVPVEPAVEVGQEQETDDYREFAQIFADTWDRKSYNALRNLFVDDVKMRLSGNEFNFLARKVDASMGITGISLESMDGDTAVYVVDVGGKETHVSADIDEADDGLRHDAFFFFNNLSADAACGDDGECYYSFAKISGDRNYCEDAGDFKVKCLQEFGMAESLVEKIDECLEITEMYSRSDCLTELAVKENDIEPCWQATFDKQRYECMGEVAAARKDVELCTEFVSSRSYPGTRLQHTYCVMGYVRETADTDACAEIDRGDDVMLGAMQESCYKLNFP